MAAGPTAVFLHAHAHPPPSVSVQGAFGFHVLSCLYIGRTVPGPHSCILSEHQRRTRGCWDMKSNLLLWQMFLKKIKKKKLKPHSPSSPSAPPLEEECVFSVQPAGCKFVCSHLQAHTHTHTSNSVSLALNASGCFLCHKSVTLFSTAAAICCSL